MKIDYILTVINIIFNFPAQSSKFVLNLENLEVDQWLSWN